MSIRIIIEIDRKIPVLVSPTKDSDITPRSPRSRFSIAPTEQQLHLNDGIVVLDHIQTRHRLRTRVYLPVDRPQDNLLDALGRFEAKAGIPHVAFGITQSNNITGLVETSLPARVVGPRKLRTYPR